MLKIIKNDYSLNRRKIINEAHKFLKQNGVDSFDPSRLTMWSDTNIFCHNKPLIKAYIELAENNNGGIVLCY